MKSGPLRFLFGVAGLWAIVRVAILWPADAEEEAVRRISWAAPIADEALPQAPRLDPQRPVFGRKTDVLTATAAAPARLSKPRAVARDGPDPLLSPAFAAVGPDEAVARSDAPFPPPGMPRAARLSLSAWAIARPATGIGGLAAAGQLGGSQAGARLRFGSASMGLTARVSAPLQSARGKEAALGLEWRPLRAVPVAFSIERRFALDRGGHDAFAAGAFGGFSGKKIGLGFVLDGYAQAGLVGFRRRNAYGDGALRLEHAVLRSGRFRLAAGAGLWGGAQPGSSRLDIGPQLVGRVPVAGSVVRIGAEWRERIAGNARPGSGPALSVGADF